MLLPGHFSGALVASSLGTLTGVDFRQSWILTNETRRRKIGTEAQGGEGQGTWLSLGM